jgi:hypothetical protein
MALLSLRGTALLAISSLVSLVSALGQKPVVSFTSSTDAFQIAGSAVGAGQILVSSSDYWGVIRAAGDLALDFGRVTGTNYTISNGMSGAGPALYNYAPVNVQNNTAVSPFFLSFFFLLVNPPFCSNTGECVWNFF